MAAADLRKVPYESLLALPHRIETFDSLPPLAEPGISFNRHWRAPGLSIGERLLGQALSETVTEFGRYDSLTLTPVAPLSVVPGDPGENYSIAFHRGFGSNAFFPTGPEGQTQLDGRGEGSLAIRFDEVQFAFGLRIHAEYPDPLGTRPMPRAAQISFYDPVGGLITRFVLPLRRGVMSLGWRSGYPVAAVVIENTDPGGIAIDDIIYEVEDLFG